ncbi:MAG: UvrD-helicase domain-containing protein [Planctomycetes bacterium]|nr:UvrD-helicase domain-containing protein [Planctomycetota bacterium]
MDYLADLTTAQREAVTHVEGPLLVLAGAGSGKTRVITRRVAHLLGQGIPDHQVLAITFTNKAAGEMRERIAALVPIRGLTVATFHAFCARMLRIYGDVLGVGNDFTIYTQSESGRAVKQAIERIGLDTTHWSPDRMQSRISHLKNRLETAAEFAKQAGDFSDKNVAKIYTAYEETLRTANALDFDDLLMKVAMGLRDNETFRNLLQDRYRFVLIDEYQDTNEAQYQIACRIAERHGNICATGDPDQSIYGWRGANIHNILDFEKDFSGCRVIRLERNYRSTPQILGAASSLIAFNRKRKAKALFTENPSGRAVRVIEVDSADDEAREIADGVRRECAAAGNYADVAVFYRVNSLSRGIEDALRAAGIPYEIVRGSSFYERQEVRALVAYLRLLVNPADDLALLRIINVPTRGIGDTTVKRLQTFAEERRTPLLEACRLVQQVDDLNARAKKSVTDFVRLLDDLTTLDRSQMQQLVSDIVRLTDFDEYCRKLEGGSDDRVANVNELVTVAASFDQEELETPPEIEVEGYSPLMRFLERVSLVSDQDDVHEEQPKVHMMTLHAAKGLEFPIVYIIGLEQGLLPHVMAQEEGRDMEEERRLCFVGMTRAKSKLTLVHARYRMQRGQTNRQMPSVFLEEIGQAGVERQSLATSSAAPSFGDNRRSRWSSGTTRRYPAARQAAPQAPTAAEREEEVRLRAALPQDASPYRPNQLVKHPTYGVGTVSEVSGSGDNLKVSVRFPHIGEKKFVAMHARLEILAKR